MLTNLLTNAELAKLTTLERSAYFAAMHEQVVRATAEMNKPYRVLPVTVNLNAPIRLDNTRVAFTDKNGR